MSDDVMPNTLQNPAPVWCVAANVREFIPSGHGGLETKRGTRKFHAGAKVYLGDAFWGSGAERVTVIGHFRGKQHITARLKTRYLTNWRAELVYSPAVIVRLAEADHRIYWNESPESKARAEEWAKNFAEFSDRLHNEQLEKQAIWKKRQDRSEQLRFLSDNGERDLW